MNNVYIKGIIKDIEDDHIIKDIEYQKADIIIPREDGKEDIVTLKFKKIFNPYKKGDKIYIEGNLRSFSRHLNGKNRVDLYIFSLLKEIKDERDEEYLNEVIIDGYICKASNIRKTQSGKDVLDFILANNLNIGEEKTLSCYIPTVAWGRHAKSLTNYKVGDYIKIKGRLQSREYKKILNNDKVEIRVAHELSISEILEEAL